MVGASIAGWLAGLPVVAGPNLFILVLAHGPIFGARAATLPLSAILASEAFNLAYAWTRRSRSWRVALVVGAYYAVYFRVWLINVANVTYLDRDRRLRRRVLLPVVLAAQPAIAAAAPLTRSDLISRMVAGAVLTLLVTSLSGWAGPPAWSGLLAVFPLLGIVLSVSSHRAHGAAFVISLLRGMVLDRFSFAAFCFLLSFSLPYQRPIVAFSIHCDRCPPGCAFAARIWINGVPINSFDLL